MLGMQLILPNLTLSLTLVQPMLSLQAPSLVAGQHRSASHLGKLIFGEYELHGRHHAATQRCHAVAHLHACFAGSGTPCNPQTLPPTVHHHTMPSNCNCLPLSMPHAVYCHNLCYIHSNAVPAATSFCEAEGEPASGGSAPQKRAPSRQIPLSEGPSGRPLPRSAAAGPGTPGSPHPASPEQATRNAWLSSALRKWRMRTIAHSMH